MFASNFTGKSLGGFIIAIALYCFTASQAVAQDRTVRSLSTRSVPTFGSGQSAITAMLLQANISNCPTNAAALRGTGRTLRCRCSPLATGSGSVWGGGPYTDDSKICRAAVHAGVISSRGGEVTLRVSAGRTTYAASTQNGVAAKKWGSWHGSFQFARRSGGNRETSSSGSFTPKSFCPATAKNYRGSGRTITCGCSGSETRAGSVWGSEIYTDDSKICRAAMHAGVIGISGGRVTFRMIGERRSYAKSNRNGVNTGSYGPWRGSFVFVPN